MNTEASNLNSFSSALFLGAGGTGERSLGVAGALLGLVAIRDHAVATATRLEDRRSHFRGKGWSVNTRNYRITENLFIIIIIIIIIIISIITEQCTLLIYINSYINIKHINSYINVKHVHSE